MNVARSQDEVDEQLNRADDALDSGSRYPGMTYEEGVANGIRWLLGQDESPPMEDDGDDEGA